MEPEKEILSAYTTVFDRLAHLGPGDPATTTHLVERLREHVPSAPRIADFGCGVGASTLVLAQCLPQARVLALDIHAPFIARLKSAANARGLGERISAAVGDMKDPPSLDGVVGGFDLVWSESAVYSIGRAQAFAYWRPLLKPDGWLVFSDIVWQSDVTARSPKASEFWAREYPEIVTAAHVIGELNAAGFDPLDPVLCPPRAWSNYYEPLRNRLRSLTQRGDRSPALISLTAEFERELDVYDCAGEDVALFLFVAQRGSSD